MNEYEGLEEDVLDCVRGVLAEFDDLIHDRALKCVLHPVKRSGSGGGYSSEVMIDFKDDKGIVDVLEFHIVRDDAAIVTVRETEAWLRQEIEGILQI